MIFRIVDFPDPLAPRMIFVWPVISVKLMLVSTTFSSKASFTWSKTTTGAPRSLRMSSADSSVVVVSTSVQQLDEQLRHEEVGGDHRHRPRHHRDRRRLADTLCAAAGPEPDMAGDGDDDEAEHERLDQPHPHVLH